MGVHLLAPGAQLRRRDRPVEGAGDDPGDQLAHLRARALDDRREPAHLLVEMGHPAELVDDRLGARNVRQRAADGRKEARHPIVPRRHLGRRMRVDVDQPPVDLPIGRPAVDRRDRHLERPVVEHRAVDERHRGRIQAGPQMGMKATRDELGPPRPGVPTLRDHLVHLDDPRRRKCARERRGGARREGEAGGARQLEVALDLAARVAPVVEMHEVVMLLLVDQRRIVDLNELVMAVIVGQRSRTGRANGRTEAATPRGAGARPWPPPRRTSGPP